MIDKATQIIEFEGQPCLLLPDEWCQKWNVQVGDTIDVSFDKEKQRIVVKPLK